MILSISDVMKTVVAKIRIESNPLLKGVDPRAKKYWITERAMVSTCKKYCYFRIPKSANSTITRTIAYYDPDIPYDESDLAVDIEGKVAKKKASTIFDVRERKLEDFIRQYTLVTFVRNPYSRVLSAFLDKIMTSNKISALRKRDVDAFSEKGEANFAGFIKYLEAGGLLLDPHWCPQRFLIPVEPNKLDFIGKVESLEEDVLNLIKCLFGVKHYVDVKTREDGRQNAKQLVDRYFTDELKRRVYELYKMDFDAFNYSK